MNSYWIGWRYIKLALLCGASGGHGLAVLRVACIFEHRRNVFLRRYPTNLSGCCFSPVGSQGPLFVAFLSFAGRLNAFNGRYRG